MVYTSVIFIYIKSLFASRQYHRFREDIIVLKSTSHSFGVTCQCGASPSVYKTQGSNRLCSSHLNRHHFDYRVYIEHRQNGRILSIVRRLSSVIGTRQ